MAGKKKRLGFAEKFQSMKLMLGILILAIGIAFHLNGMLDKEFVSLLALIYFVYAAGNVSSKFAYMKYG